MSNEDYAPADITRDAVQFAASQFGQHYIKRLHATRDRYNASAQMRDIADSQRTWFNAQAATVSLEIDYFMTAQNVQSDPNLLQRLRDKANSRRKKQEQL